MSYYLHKHSSSNIRSAYREWIPRLLNKNNDVICFHSTLTFFQRKLINGKKRFIRDSIEKIMKRFVERLNRSIYGNAHKRYNKSIFSLVTIEYGANKDNVHAHLLLGFHKSRTNKEHIEELITKIINDTPMVNNRCESGVLESPSDVRKWTNYIVKEAVNPFLLSLGNF